MKIKKNGSTELKVKEIAQPIADELGLTIWDVSYVKEGAEWYLRVFIDKEDGIDLDDCEAMTRPLNEKLDELDPVSGSYILEVGSAGLERELVRESHFEACIGLDVRVHLIIAADGVKDYVGTLAGYDKNSVKITVDGEEKEVSLSEAAYIKLYEEYDF
ncbi:MAG: ribosome maturation factor RimP [Ruminococcus sp.]|nr:ribosome maturation factor RimP [Ruminococcus sp.]